jgi:hypothetical protein
MGSIFSFLTQAYFHTTFFLFFKVLFFILAKINFANKFGSDWSKKLFDRGISQAT